jgi:hypothetical protein
MGRHKFELISDAKAHVCVNVCQDSYSKFEGRVYAKCTMTIAPALKDVYERRYGKALFDDAIVFLETLSGVERVEAVNRSVHFNLNCGTVDDWTSFSTSREFWERTADFRKEIIHASKKWHMLCEQQDSLRLLILKALKDREYERSATAHHSEKHGAYATLDIFRLAEQWT